MIHIFKTFCHTMISKVLNLINLFPRRNRVNLKLMFICPQGNVFLSLTGSWTRLCLKLTFVSSVFSKSNQQIFLWINLGSDLELLHIMDDIYECPFVYLYARILIYDRLTRAILPYMANLANRKYPCQAPDCSDLFFQVSWPPARNNFK